MPNPYEIAGRREKAAKLDAAIARRWNEVPEPRRRGRSLATMVETWGDEEWAAAAIAAGTHEPSMKTRQMVVDQIRARETPDAADPFAGLERAS